jgi:hypothetical protein
MRSVNSRCPAVASVAVARTVNVKLPPTVGVPLRTPAGLSPIPGGSVPSAIANDGLVPLVAVSVPVYGVPTVPSGIPAGPTATVGSTGGTGGTGGGGGTVAPVSDAIRGVSFE